MAARSMNGRHSLLSLIFMEGFFYIFPVIAENDDFAACFVGFPHKRLSISSMNGVDSNNSNQKTECSFEGQSRSLYRINISKKITRNAVKILHILQTCVK